MLLDAETTKPDDDPESLTDEQVALVNDSLGLVGRIAKESRERRIDYDDRFQAGCVGLIRAVQKFRPEMGFTLATYADAWIKQAIQRAARKAPTMASLDGMAEDGYAGPTDQDEPPALDPLDAERLRAVVASLPDQPRSVIVDHFWRGKAPRGNAKTTEHYAMKALRMATRGGREMPPVAPHWSDARTGEPLRPSRLSADDAKVMLHLKLMPVFPDVFTPTSKCPHQGPIPAGSKDCCMVCNRSGMDGLVIPQNVPPLPRDKVKLPPPAPKRENRKARRKREHEHSKAMALSA